MSEHTPGRLTRRPDAGQWNVSTDECGMSCYESIQDDGGTIIGFVVAHKAGFYQEPDTEANARRLVSCWNALDGLSQDALDGGWNFKDADAYTVRIEKERDSLRAVNAELLEALTEARHALQFANYTPGGPINDTIWMMHRPETLFDFMDAAIERGVSKCT